MADGDAVTLPDALRLPALAMLYALQRATERIGDAIGVPADRRLRYDARPWALTTPVRCDESPDLLIDDGDRVALEYAMAEVIRMGPVVLCADWCPDGRGSWWVLRTDREGDAAEMAARLDAQAAREMAEW